MKAAKSKIHDINYIGTNESWLYLAGMTDLHTNELVGYAINKRIIADLVCRVLNMAINNKGPSQALIVHSDRGSKIFIKANCNPIHTRR